MKQVSQNKFNVKQATLQDARALQTITNEALQFKLLQHDTAWDTEPFTTEEIKQAINRGTTYIVRVNDQPAGRVVLTWEDAHAWGDNGADNLAGYVHTLSVRDTFRGKKLGEQIINWCASKIHKAGRSLIRLDCPASNEKLCHYYERQGFCLVRKTNTGSALYEKPVSL